MQGMGSKKGVTALNDTDESEISHPRVQPILRRFSAVASAWLSRRRCLNLGQRETASHLKYCQPSLVLQVQCEYVRCPIPYMGSEQPGAPLDPRMPPTGEFVVCSFITCLGDKG